MVSSQEIGQPTVSHRAFVRRTGQKSPSLLKDVIEARRNLTPKLIDAFAKALSLDSGEAKFFRALVQLDQGSSPSEKNEAWARISASRRFALARQLDGEGFQYLTCWYYPAIRELARCPGFQADPSWIAKTLRPKISKREAAKALDVLFSLGLIVRCEGVVRATESSVVTAHEVTRLAVRNYHTGMLDRAKESIDAFRGPSRHFCSVTAAIPTSLIPLLKEELQQMQERLLDLCDGVVVDNNQVVQINLHFFPLSGRTEVP